MKLNLIILFVILIFGCSPEKFNPRKEIVKNYYQHKNTIDSFLISNDTFKFIDVLEIVEDNILNIKYSDTNVYTGDFKDHSLINVNINSLAVLQLLRKEGASVKSLIALIENLKKISCYKIFFKKGMSLNTNRFILLAEEITFYTNITDYNYYVKKDTFDTYDQSWIGYYLPKAGNGELLSKNVYWHCN